MRLTKKQQICKNTRTTHIDMSFGELKETPFAKKKGLLFWGLRMGGLSMTRTFSLEDSQLEVGSEYPAGGRVFVKGCFSLMNERSRYFMHLYVDDEKIPSLKHLKHFKHFE